MSDPRGNLGALDLGNTSARKLLDQITLSGITADEREKLDAVTISQMRAVGLDLGTITDSGGASPGDLVRLSSAGVLAKAQASSAANAVGATGVWDGSTVQPLSGYRTINFDTTPLVNMPCYVSATTAGKAGLLPNGLCLAQIGVIERVLSSTQAVVYCNSGAQYLETDARAMQVALTAAITGISPALLSCYHTEFNLKAAPTGWTMQNVTYNALGAVCVTTGSAQVISGGLSAGLSFATLGAFKWSIGHRVKLANAKTLSMIYMLTSANSGSVGLYFSAAAGLQVRWDTGVNPAVSLPANYTQIVAPGGLGTTDAHIFALYSLGNNTFLVRADGTFYGPYAISQAADFSGSSSVYSLAKDDGGTMGITYSEQWMCGNHRGYTW